MSDVNQQNEKNAPQEDIGQLLKVRRQKFADLQAAGRDPFVITKFDQTHHTDEVIRLYEEHEKEILKDYTEPELVEPAEGADNETISAYRQAKKEEPEKKAPKKTTKKAPKKKPEPEPEEDEDDDDFEDDDDDFEEVDD